MRADESAVLERVADALERIVAALEKESPTDAHIQELAQRSVEHQRQCEESHKRMEAMWQQRIRQHAERVN